MIPSIDRKLFRDLWALRGQALAIALVIVSGVGTYIMSLSTLDSLRETRRQYYAASRFADAFVSLKRAPESLAARIREISGVEHIETRVVAAVPIDLPGFPDPIAGRLVSIPDAGEPLLHRLTLRAGQLPRPGSDRQVVVSEAFAEAHGLEPGAQFRVVINGRRKTLEISGIALSAEFIYQIRPAA